LEGLIQMLKTVTKRTPKIQPVNMCEV
jgi:hypothetical protein